MCTDCKFNFRIFYIGLYKINSIELLCSHYRGCTRMFKILKYQNPPLSEEKNKHNPELRVLSALRNKKSNIYILCGNCGSVLSRSVSSIPRLVDV